VPAQAVVMEELPADGLLGIGFFKAFDVADLDFRQGFLRLYDLQGELQVCGGHKAEKRWRQRMGSYDIMITIAERAAAHRVPALAKPDEVMITAPCPVMATRH
jgi:hypothetical protein